MCIVCGNKENLHVHHILPAWKFPDKKHNLGNLVTLCRSCHLRIQGFNRKHGVYIVPYKDMWSEPLFH